MIDWEQQVAVSNALLRAELEIAIAMGVSRDNDDQGSVRACISARDLLRAARKDSDDASEGRSIVENDAAQAEFVYGSREEDGLPRNGGIGPL